MRPLGCLFDPPGEGRGEPLARLAAVSAARTIPFAATLQNHITLIDDQIGNECVGQALAQCLRIRSHIDGRPIDPSWTAIYAVARSLEHPSAHTLADVGSFPFRGIEGLSDWGVVARRRWPGDVDHTLPVPVDVLEAGALAYITGEYRIGDEREVQIKQAICAGHPVFFAMSVDASYQHYSGGLWRGMSGPSMGGHAQCIVGYDEDGVIVANSWGLGWGEGGLSRISWDAIASADCTNFYVITHAPLEVV